MSSDLLWLCVRDNSSFIRKSRGITLTSEPCNLTQINSFKYSGLCNKKAVGIEAAADQGVEVSFKVQKNKNKPATSTRKTILKRGNRRALKSISNDVAGNYYRPDLKKAALKRASAILAAQKELNDIYIYILY